MWELPHPAQTGLAGRLVLHRVEIVSHLFIGMGSEHGPDHRRQPGFRDHCLQPRFLRPLQVADPAQKGMCARQRTEGANSGCLEGALVIIADPAGPGVADRLAHLVFMTPGDKDRQLVQLLLRGRVQDPDPSKAEALCQQIVHAAHSRIHVGVRRVNVDPVFNQPDRQRCREAVVVKPGQGIADQGMMGHDQLRLFLDCLCDHFRSDLQGHQHLLDLGIPCAHLKTDIVPILGQQGRRPFFQPINHRLAHNRHCSHFLNL